MEESKVCCRPFYLLPPALFLGVALLPIFCYGGTDTLYMGDRITGNQTRISSNGTFELGFFRPGGATKWYVGIWFVQVDKQTVVWVANRETPLESNDGVFTLTREGSLVLFEGNGARAWEAQGDRSATRATILDSGNLVVMGNNGTVWESFEQSGDTLLPGMKIGMGQKLSAWRNSWDPAPGPFTLELDRDGLSQFVLLWNGSVQYWQSGLWNGQIFSGLPEMATKYVYEFSFVENGTDTYFTYSVKPGVSLITRLVLDKSGELRLYTWIDQNQWNMFWSQPRDQCQIFDVCGPYGVCTQNNNLRFCDCVNGFVPGDSRAWEAQDWSGGCVRPSALDCRNESTDGFVELKGKSITDPGDYLYEEKTLEGCQSVCLKNCSCVAFGFSVSNSSSCRIWVGDIFTLRDVSNSDEDLNAGVGDSVFIRLAAADVPHPAVKLHHRWLLPGTLIAAVTGCLTLIMAAVLGFYLWWRMCGSSRESYKDLTPGSLRMFTYRELQIATKNFAHRLGGGGFGSVYKGVLADKTAVGVKILEGSSQGEKQFRMEVSTIGTIQHMNLVRLRGFCSEGSRRMLVYDYMPNGSLNTLLFPRKEQKTILDWRTRFGIALGTARGILYLHEKCRDCIIHCDIKPENILLDANFCPKVSDFGLAKLVGRDFSHVLTTMRGTRGYLAPEWISGMPITAKADVYSFGMTLLEIIAGRRNMDFSAPSSRLFFPTWAGAQMKLGNIEDLLDIQLKNNADMEQVKRAAMVGGWCIQDDEEARPSMAHVVNILEGIVEVDTPPVPKSLLLLMEGGGGGGEGDIIYSEKALITKHCVHNNNANTA